MLCYMMLYVEALGIISDYANKQQEKKDGAGWMEPFTQNPGTTGNPVIPNLTLVNYGLDYFITESGEMKVAQMHIVIFVKRKVSPFIYLFFYTKRYTLVKSFNTSSVVRRCMKSCLEWFRNECVMK